MRVAVLDGHVDVPRPWSASLIGCHGVDSIDQLPPECVVAFLSRTTATRLGPDRLAGALARYGGRLVVVGPRTEAAHEPSPRESLGLVHVAREHVAHAIVDALDRIPLQRLRPSDWRPFDGDRHRASIPEELLVVPRLDRFDSGCWRRSAGLSRRELTQFCGRTFGAGPGAVLRLYRLATARWLRARGFASTTIAATTGYSSREALQRAMRAADRLGVA